MKRIIYTDCTDPILHDYLRDISKFPILSQEEIAQLVVKAQEGDMWAKETVIKGHLRFVVTLAKRWQGRGVPLMDLISEGTGGLIYAVSKFDISKGVPFINYSAHWIKQYIYQAIYWTGRAIRLPVSQHLRIVAITKATQSFMKKQGRAPSAEEIAEMTGVDEDDIHYLAQFSNKMVAMDEYLGEFGDAQVCETIPDGEPLLDEATDKEFMYKELKILVERLPAREHDIICLLFGINMDPLENHLVADLFGIGVERVRQIKEAALKKLRKTCKKKFKDYR